MNLTLESLIDTFQDAISAISEDVEEDEEGADAEYMYLNIVLQTLLNTNEELKFSSVSEDSKLSVAASRIPGLLYLYQLY
jgi:hypothetical protein